MDLTGTPKREKTNPQYISPNVQKKVEQFGGWNTILRDLGIRDRYGNMGKE